MSSFIDAVFSAGIVGCGGAGFPTHVKLNTQVKTFIINAAECEPLLRTDRYLCRNKAQQIVSAAEATRQHLGADVCFIALKASYHQEILSLESAIEDAGLKTVQLRKMSSFYPAGDEQTIVHEVTGRVVPPLGIPLDVGCVVSNVATVYSIYHALKGRPFVKKYLTVTGEVASPSVLCVPLGTSFDECISLAGGTEFKDFAVISGGPMMGKVLTGEQINSAVVTKTTSGIIVLPREHSLVTASEMPIKQMLRRASTACIRCSFCSQLCPRHLLGHPLEPHKIMSLLSGGTPPGELLDNEILRSAQLCCECGVCEIYACPMGLQPRRVNAAIKRELAAAGIRGQKGSDEYTPSPLADYRKAPTKRIANRAGVGKYYSFDSHAFLEHSPKSVSIALNSHIGAPAVPCVAEGSRVETGDLIAKCPEGKLGANYHASVTGTVTGVGGGRITINKD